MRLDEIHQLSDGDETLEDIFHDMYDDLSVQTLIGDIVRALRRQFPWDHIKQNIEHFEDEAQTELTPLERKALFHVFETPKLRARYLGKRIKIR